MVFGGEGIVMLFEGYGGVWFSAWYGFGLVCFFLSHNHQGTIIFLWKIFWFVCYKHTSWFLYISLVRTSTECMSAVNWISKWLPATWNSRNRCEMAALGFICLQMFADMQSLGNRGFSITLFLFRTFWIIFSLTYEPSGYIPLFYVLQCMLKNPPDNLLLYARDKTFTKLQTAGTHFSMNFGCLLEIPRTKNWIKVLLEALLHSSAIYTIRLKMNLPLLVNAQ